MTNPTKSIRIGLGVLFIVCMLAVVYTLFVVGDPDFFIKRSCRGYTGQSWAELAAASPATAAYIRALERKVGAFGLVLTIGTLFVLFGAFKKGEGWAWWFFLIATAGGWLVNIIFHIFSKSPLGLAMSVVGIAAVLIVLIFTAKDFLGNKSV